jgi:uncharacterized metal-binding protein
MSSDPPPERVSYLFPGVAFCLSGTREALCKCQVLERFLVMKTTLSAEAAALLAEILALSPSEIRYVLARAEELQSK